MAIFDDKVRGQLTEILKNMKEEVTLVFFSQEIECFTCRDARSFVEEVSSLNSKIKLEKYNLVEDSEKTELYKIDKVPAIAVADKNGADTGIRFYGIPAGYEISSFLSALLETSGVKEVLSKEIMERIAKVDKDVHIQVFVTLGCPHCPKAVETAHRLALENKNIKADMIESNSFAHLVARYNISSVPKIVINDRFEFVGAQPMAAFLDVLEKV